MYTVLLRETAFPRDEVMGHLEAEGIETRPVFYPMHVMPVYREPDGSYPVAESIAQNGINLPTHGLLLEDDIAYIGRHCVTWQKNAPPHLLLWRAIHSATLTITCGASPGTWNDGTSDRKRIILAVLTPFRVAYTCIYIVGLSLPKSG